MSHACDAVAAFGPYARSVNEDYLKSDYLPFIYATVLDISPKYFQIESFFTALVIYDVEATSAFCNRGNLS